MGTNTIRYWTTCWSRKSPRPIKKGNIRYLLNERLSLTPANLLDIFESHGIARKKLRNELQLFMQGEKDALRFFYTGEGTWKKYISFYVSERFVLQFRNVSFCGL